MIFFGDNQKPQEDRNVRASSISSNKSSKKRRNNRKKKAKEWTYYKETLKNSIDCLYEICRAEQSVIGCKEAMMYLQNADRDFQSLIEAINLEKTFSQNEPQAVAWEIRKSMNSPTHNFHDKKWMNALPMSPMIINEITLSVVKGGGESNVNDRKKDRSDDPDDGWQVVTNRRRKSTSSSLGENEKRNEIQEEDCHKTRPPSVYERLSSGINYRKHGVDSPTRIQTSSRVISRGASASGKLTCPRSAMDLPQTKASMAKISYCRQRLWEKDIKPNLTEKLARQKRERALKPLSQSVSRINFSDPATVRKRALEYSESLKKLRKKPSLEARSLQSLQSINENGEFDSGDVVPCDPKPSNQMDITTRSEPPRMDSIFNDFDQEWREMTAEEESLAIEEQSLNMEIEKAESELESTDAELARQVDEEAESYPIQESPEDSMEAAKARALMFRKLEDEFKNFLMISWSDMMDKELSGQHVHEPGMAAERHEKMSSPTRRKCEKDDDDFSKRHVEKLKRADEAREKLRQERLQKLQDLSRRRDEVRAKQAALIEKKKQHLEKRMERAQENRDKNITEIVKKAKSDEQRVMEIQFINSMQDDNMRYMMQSKEQHVEERKQILVEVRAKKNEEKALKEQAVEERRRKAEEKRLAKIQESEEKRTRRMQMALEKKMAIKLKKEKDAEETELSDALREKLSLKSLVVRQQWPSSDHLDDIVICPMCSDSMMSSMDCFVHVLGEKHLFKTQIIASNATAKILGEEFLRLKIDKRSRIINTTVTKQAGAISADNFQFKYEQGNEKFRTNFKEVNCSSIQATSLIDAVKFGDQKLTEKGLEAIGNALKAIQTDSSIAASFVPAADLLIGLIINGGEYFQLTSFLKLCSLIERCSISVSFALKSLFSPSIFHIFNSLNTFSKENPSSPQFSAIMDVCLAILQPVQMKKNIEEVGISEEMVRERIDLIYETVSAFGFSFPHLITRGDSAVKWTRLHNFASFFISKGNEETSLPILYIDTLIRETYEAFRLSTGNDSKDKPNRCDSEITSKLANRMLHILERIQQSRQPILWAAFFNSSIRNLRFFLLCTELLRRCILRIKSDPLGMNIIPQLMFFLRYFTAKSPFHQILCMIGGEKSTIGTICQLPKEFFQGVIAIQTIPTLVLMTYGSSFCLQLMTKRICNHIINFIMEATTNQQNRNSLKAILPEENWKQAIEFYKV